MYIYIYISVRWAILEIDFWETDSETLSFWTHRGHETQPLFLVVSFRKIIVPFNNIHA